MTIAKTLDLCTPVWCRLAAVRYPQSKKWQWPVPMTDEEICATSGLSKADVKYIGMLTVWDEIPCGKMRRFMEGCQLTFRSWVSFQRRRNLMARGKFTYLRRHQLWDSQFQELVQIYESAHGRPDID